MSPKARHAKAKSRITAYDKLLNEEKEKGQKELVLYIPVAERLGDLVIEIENLSKAYDDNILIDGLSFSIPPGAVVGIIGPNGAGKTTLFKMITGQEKPDKGNIKIGSTVKLSYVDQSRDALNPDKSIWELISGGEDTILLGSRTINSRAYVAQFNFSGADQQKKISMLSKQGANVILLDEPTNDLDVNTLRALEEAIEKYAGCVLIISHDRWFLDRVSTHILAFDGESKVTWFDGNYTEYEERRKELLGAEADQPHRIKYRHLTRA
jgi:ATPase subunit of ABC transporter with duplicated ATPase domains